MRPQLLPVLLRNVVGILQAYREKAREGEGCLGVGSERDSLLTERDWILPQGLDPTPGVESERDSLL